MKGVILSRTEAQLVDVSHSLPRQDPRAAAFWLREVIPYYPPAVHLAVIDPGVGTDRRAIAIRVGGHALVAPDNGLLRPVVRRLAERHHDPPISAYEITVDDPASSTFHGRDVFAPAAAEIHERGVDQLATLDMLSPIDLASCVDLSFPEPTAEGDTIHGEVLVVDDFGNVITNIPGEMLTDAEQATVAGLTAPIVDTFDRVDTGARLLTVGSHGYIECDVNQGRGDEAFGLAAGDSVRVVVDGETESSE